VLQGELHGWSSAHSLRKIRQPLRHFKPDLVGPEQYGEQVGVRHTRVLPNRYLPFITLPISRKRRPIFSRAAVASTSDVGLKTRPNCL